MPDFEYVARATSGKQITGVLTAGSEQDALTQLASRQLFPVKIDLAAAEQKQQKHAGRRVSPRHLAIFYGQLSDLLRSGVPLLRSLELLQRQSPHATMRLVLQDIRDQVADGTELAEAMKRHPRVFSELVHSMVHAGEAGGFVEDVLKRTAKFTEQQQELKSRVVGAMVYPMFLFGIGSIITVVMMVYFVPKFEPIFKRMEARGQIHWTTNSLMTTSDFMQAYWMWGTLALIILGASLFSWFKTDAGRLLVDQVRLKIPGMGQVVRSLAISRFCRVLGTLLNNGVPILQSLQIAKSSTGNVVLTQSIGEAAENVSTGKSLAAPLSESGEFPVEVVEMISVGEEANNLEQVLIDVADNMEKRTYRQLDLFVRMLEPVMLTVGAVVVLFLVYALLTPILQSSGLV